MDFKKAVLLSNTKANIDGKVAVLVGIVVIISLIVGMGATFFNGLDNITGAPAYFTSTAPIIVGAGLLMLIWRALK